MSKPEAVYVAIARFCGDGHTVTIRADREGYYGVSVLCKGDIVRHLHAGGATIAEAFASAERLYLDVPWRTG